MLRSLALYYFPSAWGSNMIKNYKTSFRRLFHLTTSLKMKLFIAKAPEKYEKVTLSIKYLWREKLIETRILKNVIAQQAENSNS